MGIINLRWIDGTQQEEVPVGVGELQEPLQIGRQMGGSEKAIEIRYNQNSSEKGVDESLAKKSGSVAKLGLIVAAEDWPPSRGGGGRGANRGIKESRARHSMGDFWRSG